MVDSRAARDLTPERRALLDKDEMAWLDDKMRGGFRHLLVGTSLPFLLPLGLHHVESWNEALSEGAWGRRAARFGEKVRQTVDLEHWGAFQNSFRKVAGMVSEVADGKRGPAPEIIAFLSGDVHFSYVSEVERSSGSRIVQAVCSPDPQSAAPADEVLRRRHGLRRGRVGWCAPGALGKSPESAVPLGGHQRAVVRQQSGHPGSDAEGSQVLVAIRCGG